MKDLSRRGASAQPSYRVLARLLYTLEGGPGSTAEKE